ncbi:hypothetical protein TL18_04785 [Methanobrevibacter sp. YE315]|uniref:glycosyltransferase n=1 Tax=Methanobrevibacter sp. YE315 TaxID=1609968 RepID=UPI000764DE39|nr:glycosyltransferase [Methanobrevibacter sp. YE315]AMD17394.1 hypothetical protein TL18_04785 [Methanobrevibacter sp. YE315]
MGLKNKIKHKKEDLVNSYIYRSYYDDSIDENIVYLESRDGHDFTGNILRIAEELSTGAYGNLKIYVYAEKEVFSKIEELKGNYDLNIHKVITKESTATRILEKAKYIFTDSGIRPKYVKKEGQIFINTWHGTPLKVMGFDNVSEQHRIANIQHTLLSSDYLLYPNEYMKEKMMNSYMIEKIYPGKILMEGYPRNSVFFDDSKRKEFRMKFNLDDYQISVYMPTFKGLFINRDYEKQSDMTGFLEKIDSRLSDDQIMFVKLHVYTTSKIDFDKFKHIRPFPQGYETYDILNMADVLITDYSSVLFDFANTSRKIVLFNFDESDYQDYRGLYFSMDRLPFPKVQTIDDLIDQLNSPKEYDDAEFRAEFSRYDRIDSAKYICRHIFNNENVCLEKRIENVKENILIYAGSLLNNGITSSLINLLENIDLERYNYFISYLPWDENIIENHEEIFKRFPKEIEFLPFRFPISPTISEKNDFDKFMSSQKDAKLTKPLHRLFKRSYDKQYGNLNIKEVINFDGYNKKELLIFAHADTERTVWVHSNMIQEKRTRDNQNLNILREAYSSADNVVVVSKDLIEPTAEISGRKDNIRIIHNFNNYDQITANSKMDLVLDEATEVYPNSESIFNALNRPCEKFITIGRFSPEKGHERLLKAFDRFCKDNPETQLIIIGGHGELYEDTIELVNGLDYSDNVVLVKNISNPMPILAKCDLFVLPSYYEGWGIVAMEADTLGVPVIACDVPGLQWLRDYNGNIFENSEDGILEGMREFENGNIKTLEIDYAKYNEEILDSFYLLVDG